MFEFDPRRTDLALEHEANPFSFSDTKLAVQNSVLGVGERGRGRSVCEALLIAKEVFAELRGEGEGAD